MHKKPIKTNIKQNQLFRMYTFILLYCILLKINVHYCFWSFFSGFLALPTLLVILSLISLFEGTIHDDKRHLLYKYQWRSQDLN